MFTQGGLVAGERKILSLKGYDLVIRDELNGGVGRGGGNIAIHRVGTEASNECQRGPCTARKAYLSSSGGSQPRERRLGWDLLGRACFERTFLLRGLPGTNHGKKRGEFILGTASLGRRWSYVISA